MAHIQLHFILFTALNLFIFANTKYVRSPSHPTTNLNKSIDLKCEYLHGDGEFVEWYKDDMRVNDEKPGHYAVKTSKTESKLSIKIFVLNDSYVQRWYVKTNKKGFEVPKGCVFGSIKLVPSPQSIETNKTDEKLDSEHASVRREEDESVTFKCNIEPNEDRDNPILWEFKSGGSSFTKLPDSVVRISDNVIFIARIKKSDRGYYRCSLNDYHFQVLLRVKDRFAALWPFLGIVGVVLLLVIVILIFEKRQKSAKKAATTEDEDRDHANDPLVRSPNKSSDNENKKRAIKT